MPDQPDTTDRTQSSVLLLCMLAALALQGSAIGAAGLWGTSDMVRGIGAGSIAVWLPWTISAVLTGMRNHG
jgi:hypothetical protein